MLFCHPESEAATAKHKGLGKEKGVIGLPGIAFFEPDGEVVVIVPASVHSVTQFEQYGKRARQLLRLRELAQKGDARAAAALLIAQLEERQLQRLAAEARRAKLVDEGKAERSRLDELLLDLRIGEELTKVHDDPAGRRALGIRYLDMLAAGKRPSDAVSRGFWFVILESTEAKGDAKGFEVGLAGLRRNVELTAGDAAWGVNLVADYEQRLVRLKAKQ